MGISQIDPTRFTTQNLQNLGFDTTYNEPTVLIVGQDTSNNVLRRAQVDASGNLKVNIASGGGSGGTASSFGAAFPSVGTAVGATDGTNMQPLSVDGSGYLEVNVKAGSGSGLAVTDEASFTAGTSQFIPNGGVFNDSVTSLTSGQQGVVRLTGPRAMHINLRNNSGTEIATSSTPAVVKLGDGTNTGNVLATTSVSNSATTQGAQLIAGAYATQTSLSAGSLNANLVPSTDVSNYKSFSLQITGTWSGTLTFQGSNDNSNFVSVPAIATTNLSNSYVTTTTANAMFYGPIQYRYFQVVMTSYTSGTANGTLELYTNQHVPITQSVTASQNGGYNVAVTSALPVGTDIIGKVGIDQTTPGTTNGISIAQIGSTTVNTAASGTILVGIADGSGNALTSNSTTYTSKKALDGNLLGVLGTAFTTAGVVNVQGISGGTNIPVSQAIASNLNATVVGQATGSAVPSTAFYQGGNAATALPTATTATDLVGAMYDKFGRVVTLPNAMRDLVSPMTQLTLTSTTSETTLISQVASTFLDLVSIVAINTSATATQADFRDSTGGTIRLSLYLPAGDTRGVSFTTPLPQNSVNNNWTAKCSTSVASVIITGTYISNK